MNYIKLLIISCIVISTSYSNFNQVNLDASRIGKTIPEQLFKGTKTGISTGKALSKGLLALRIKALNDALQIEKQKKNIKNNKQVNKNSNKNYFVVAKVGNDVITNIDILNTIKFICFASNQHYNKSCAKLILNSVLDSLIDNSIRKQFAELQDIPIDNKLIEDKIEEIAKNNNKTVEELGKAFEEAGINMEIFRKNLYSKLLLTMFYQMMEKSTQASDESLKQYKNKYSKDIKKTRYKISEIFLKIDDVKNKENIEKQAQSIIELLKKGFNFRILAENLSNSGNTSLDNLEWKTEDVLQKPVLDKVKNMQVGTYSDIIKLDNGYKIIYLIDKAEPNKDGQSTTTYNVTTSEIPMDAKTQGEMFDLQNKLQSLSEADSIEEFNRVCKNYEIKTEKQIIKEPDMMQSELIKRNKTTGKTGILRIDEVSPFKILFIESESVPKAEIPSDEQINNIILHKKVLQIFNKNMKRIKSQIYVTVNKEKLQKVLNEDEHPN